MGSAQSHVAEEHGVNRTGKWLPQDHRVHKEWLRDVIENVENHPKELHPVFKEFRDMIEGDTRKYLLFSSMFEQIPSKKPYDNDPTGHRQIHDYDHMLRVLNHLLTAAPSWSNVSERSGFATFLDPKVNAMLKKVLDTWAKYLESPASTEVLDDDSKSWFSQTGVKGLEKTANIGETPFSFGELFVCDPSAKHHGFKSWDAFFTHQFREGIRPVAAPGNPDVIVNACESIPFNVAHGVKARDQFWNKGQPYSVSDMLAHDGLTEQFVGGTVSQAFLSALSYHRWHSPVAGRIVKSYMVHGTYYSEPLFAQFDATHGADDNGQVAGQGYLTAAAVRAIIFIEADNATIGLMAFLGVGMAEVSNCYITVKEGEHVEKGDQIGMFYFGGSTHCLLFRKGVNVGGFPDPSRQLNIPVRGEVAIVRSNK